MRGLLQPTFIQSLCIVNTNLVKQLFHIANRVYAVLVSLHVNLANFIIAYEVQLIYLCWDKRAIVDYDLLKETAEYLIITHLCYVYEELFQIRLCKSRSEGKIVSVLVIIKDVVVKGPERFSSLQSITHFLFLLVTLESV